MGSNKYLTLTTVHYILCLFATILETKASSFKFCLSTCNTGRNLSYFLLFITKKSSLYNVMGLHWISQWLNSFCHTVLEQVGSNLMHLASCTVLCTKGQNPSWPCADEIQPPFYRVNKTINIVNGFKSIHSFLKSTHCIGLITLSGNKLTLQIINYY